jgi:hypothetical protein
MSSIRFKLEFVIGNDKPNWKMAFVTKTHQNQYVQDENDIFVTNINHLSTPQQ